MRLTSTLFRHRFRGLDNQSDAVRLSSREPIALSEAKNVYVDDSGMIHSRPGQQYVYRGAGVHSLWSNGARCYFASGTTLYRFGDHYEPVAVINNINPEARIRYCDVNQRVYLTNGYSIGYLDGDTYTALTDPGIPFKAKMPAGHLLETYHARLFVARSHTVYYSDAAAYNYYDQRNGFMDFDSTIGNMMAVSGGLFLSDEHRTFFLSGATANEFVLTTVYDQPALPGSFAKARGLNDISASIVIFAVPDGLMIGGPDGSVKSLTSQYYSLYDNPINVSLCRYESGNSYYLLVSEMEEANISNIAQSVIVSGGATISV